MAITLQVYPVHDAVAIPAIDAPTDVVVQPPLPFAVHPIGQVAKGDIITAYEVAPGPDQLSDEVSPSAEEDPDNPVGAAGGPATTVTLLNVESPDELKQVTVYVCEPVGVTAAEPLTAVLLLNVFEQDTELVLAHVSVEEPPPPTTGGDAVSVTTGGMGYTFTVK